jgi:ferredoxin-NADP reductase
VESTAERHSLGWQIATVIEVVDETPRTKSVVLDLPDRRAHHPGQHVDLRFVAADGYQAQRSYSIASVSDDEYVVLTVQRLDGGEVSSYLVDELRRGDELEVRGPVGEYFTWDGGVEHPLLLVAGGPGIAPIRSMLRYHEMTRSTAPLRLLYSPRRSMRSFTGTAAHRGPRRDGRQRHADSASTTRLARVPGPCRP